MVIDEHQVLSDKESTSTEIGECHDLAKLSLLTEDILLEHLKRRYEQDVIYVSVFFS